MVLIKELILLVNTVSSNPIGITPNKGSLFVPSDCAMHCLYSLWSLLKMGMWCNSSPEGISLTIVPISSKRNHSESSCFSTTAFTRAKSTWVFTRWCDFISYALHFMRAQVSSLTVHTGKRPLVPGYPSGHSFPHISPEHRSFCRKSSLKWASKSLFWYCLSICICTYPFKLLSKCLLKSFRCMCVCYFCLLQMVPSQSLQYLPLRQCLWMHFIWGTLSAQGVKLPWKQNFSVTCQEVVIGVNEWDKGSSTVRSPYRCAQFHMKLEDTSGPKYAITDV